MITRSEYYKNWGYPIRCVHCDSTDISFRVKDCLDAVVCEKEYYCKNCNNIVAYWAYGCFDFNFETELILYVNRI